MLGEGFIRPIVFGGGFCPSQLSDSTPTNKLRSAGTEGHSGKLPAAWGAWNGVNTASFLTLDPAGWVSSRARRSPVCPGLSQARLSPIHSLPRLACGQRADGWPGDQPLEHTALSGHCGTRHHQCESLESGGDGPQGLLSKGTLRLGPMHRPRALTCPLPLRSQVSPSVPTVTDVWVSEPSPGALVPCC